MFDAFRRSCSEHDPMALYPCPLEQLGQRPLKRRRRKVVKADLSQGYALLPLVVLRDELVEEPDAERGGAFWHRRGIFRGPSHARDVEMRPGDIVDKALEKLRAEHASPSPNAADIFPIGRVAVDLAVIALGKG